MKYAKTHGIMAAHEQHMPTCKCVLRGNLHKYDSKPCVFADNFLCKYADGVWDFYEPHLEYPDCVSLCCCSPEYPHEESMKFMILSKNESDLHWIPFWKCNEGKL